MMPQAHIATVARRYVGTRENTPNDSPTIRLFWRDTEAPGGWRERYPWCAAFVCHCVAQAAREQPALAITNPCHHVAVAMWLSWAREPGNGCRVWPADVLTSTTPAPAACWPLPGDLLIMLPRLSHIGIIADAWEPGHRLVTVEGNTNGEGSRDGDGVYVRQRDVTLGGWIIRLAARALPVV